MNYHCGDGGKAENDGHTWKTRKPPPRTLDEAAQMFPRLMAGDTVWFPPNSGATHYVRYDGASIGFDPVPEKSHA